MLTLFLFILIIFFNLIILIYFNNLVKFLNINDKPSELRKIHAYPVPSIGGLIILFNLLFFLVISFYENSIFLIFEGERSLISLFIVSIFITFFGICDDKYGISPTNKLLILSLLIYLSLLLDNNLIINYLYFNENFYLGLNQFGIFFTIICFIIFLNAFNMFDGINGQSGCYSLIILAFLYIKNPNILILFLSLSIIFFLYLNFKNKTFLGDNGSYLLSYLLSCLIVKNYNLPEVILTVEEIMLLMIYPGLDLVRLFLTRSIKGRHPFFPDSNHIHHIILDKTKSQLITLLINMSCISIPVIFYLYTEHIYISLILTISSYLIVYLYFNRKINV